MDQNGALHYYRKLTFHEIKVLEISKIQLVVYYQCCVLIG